MDTQDRIDSLLQDFETSTGEQVGYPCNHLYDYSALWPFLRYSANNVGDPFHDSNFRPTPTRSSARSSTSSPT